MRRSIVLLSILMLFAASAAQSQVKPPSEGSKALLFNFNGFNANMYQGGIGGKYFFSDALALRAMLMFGIDNKSIKTTPEQTDNTLSFGIGAGLEYHFPISASISPYLGGALSYTINSESINSGTATTTNMFALGVLGGVEYFFNQNLSLGAEYQFGFSSTSTSQPGGPDRNEFTLGFQSAGLTLGVYF